MEKVNKVKTAIIGCGMISNIYIKNLKNLFHIIDLVAICDINPAAAEEKSKTYGIDLIMTLEEIAASKEIELVVNLTAAFAHYDVLKQMILAGKHVYTEKMMTTDLDKGFELVKLAEEKGVYFGVAPDTVLGAGIQTAKKAIESGLIGEVTSVSVNINRNQSLNAELFRFLRGEGGALPYDVGIYYVAALLCLLGPVKSIKAFGVKAKKHDAELLYTNEFGTSWQIPGNNILCGILTFENGAVGSLHFDGNSVNAIQHAFTVYGTEGILKVGDPDQFGDKVEWIRQEGGSCILPQTHGYNGQNTLDPTPFDHYGHRGIGVAEMAWAIRKGRKNRCSKEYGLHCMEVLCGMDLAADTDTVYETKSRFVMEPLKSGYYSSLFGGGMRGDAEFSLID